MSAFNSPYTTRFFKIEDAIEYFEFFYWIAIDNIGTTDVTITNNFGESFVLSEGQNIVLGDGGQPHTKIKIDATGGGVAQVLIKYQG